LVGKFRQQGQMLANLDAWDAGGNRSELAANFGRRIHLEIENVLVRGAARQKDHDHGLL
jgi:hypothetical protein